MDKPIFALIDCNSFYCSCEQVFQPQWKGHPVVVLSNNDGCAIARTPEAKALGIEMGTPEFKIRENPQWKHVKMFSSNYTLYGDMSKRVQDVVEEFAPDMEIYSIDEVFVRLDSFARHKDITEYGREIRAAVLKWTGIPTGVGIGPTKTLAKIANNIAKHDKATGGVFSLVDENQRNNILDHFPIEKVWGIGKATQSKLLGYGIDTAGKLRDWNLKIAQKETTIVGKRMVLELRGQCCIPLEECPPARKNTAVTRSFGKPVTDLNEMREAISTYAARGAEKLRQHDLVAGKLMVFMHTSKYRNTKQYATRLNCNLAPMTNDSRIIIGEAVRLAEAMWKQGIEFGKAGIILDDLRPPEHGTLNMFAEHKPLSNELMAAIDTINKKQGKHAVQFAGMGTKRRWALRKEYCSPHYTTRLEEVLRLRG